MEKEPETRKSTRILEKKENKNVYKKEEKEIKKPTLRIVKKVKHNSVEDEIDYILSKMNKKPVTKKGYKYKLLQLIREYKPKNKNNLDLLITDVDK